MSLSVAHFEHYEWTDVPGQADQPICRQYAGLFGERMKRAEDEDDADAEVLYGTLRAVTAPYLALEAVEAPLPGVGELDKQTLNVLADALPLIDDPELRARVGDILWLRRIGDDYHHFAVEAVRELSMVVLRGHGSGVRWMIPKGA